MCNLIFSEYKEKIVRIGPNYNLGLDHLSLENYVITWLSENDRKMIFKGENNTLETSRLSILNSSILIYATISCTGYSLMRKICSDRENHYRRSCAGNRVIYTNSDKEKFKTGYFDRRCSTIARYSFF